MIELLRLAEVVKNVDPDALLYREDGVTVGRDLGATGIDVHLAAPADQRDDAGHVAALDIAGHHVVHATEPRLRQAHERPSATDFMSASPFSKLAPINRSMPTNRCTTFVTKLRWPTMLHVTAVRWPSGLNVNSAVLVAAKGFRNSRLTLISSDGRLSVSVMRPSPTCLLPVHM